MSDTSYFSVTDQFCGAGGSSLGCTAAGCEVVLAMNHWKLAIDTHNNNFPNTTHVCTDISACDPRRYPTTTMLVTSPECVNHSLAKGRKRKGLGQPGLPGLEDPRKIDPGEERSRATMWDVPRFAEYHNYTIVIVENVIEARLWRLFDAWLQAMKALDYEHKILSLNSQFFPPTPQSRDRLFCVFWKRGNPAPDLDYRPEAYCFHCDTRVAAVQSWKNPTKKWGKYGKNGQYIYRCPQCAKAVIPFYYAAANAIDWAVPATRIGDRAKPLKENTLRRVRIGLERFGCRPTCADPGYIPSSAASIRPATTANPTQTAAQSVAVNIPPFIIGLDHTHAPGNRARSVYDVWPTQTTRQDKALITPPFITELYGTSTARPITQAISTITAQGNHHGLVIPPEVETSFFVSYYGQDSIRPVYDALGTLTTVDRHALVTPPIEIPPIQVEDCSFRMLLPHEVGKAMAFPETYIVLGNAKMRVKQFGNAVTPPVMQWLVQQCKATLT